MKKILSLIFLLPAALTALAQQTDSIQTRQRLELDTLEVIQPKRVLNDYSMIGVSYGVSFNHVLFNPTQENSFFFSPHDFTVTYTKYNKLFGYMPYFGFSAGLRYAHEGYKFETDENGASYMIEGAQQAVMRVVELPLMAQFHVDSEHFKFLGSFGLYGGYRLNIERTGPRVSEEMIHAFKDTDFRWDYGLQGGLGFAVVFDPVEIQLNATLRYGWSSLYQPNTFSDYYYRYAYPFDIMVSAGVHIHLQNRYGATRKELRERAYQEVYNPVVVPAGNKKDEYEEENPDGPSWR